MFEGKTAFPLSWPFAKPRTPDYRRRRSVFKQTFAEARDFVYDELRKMNVKEAMISSNIELRLDGIPYANKPEPRDPGIAVYFRLKGKEIVFACDSYTRAWENLYAIGLTIEATRSIERWGAASLEQSFAGFQALPSAPPAPTVRDWWIVLGIPRAATADECKAKYRTLAFDCHPDRGGSAERMAELNEAYAKCLAEKRTV